MFNEVTGYFEKIFIQFYIRRVTIKCREFSYNSGTGTGVVRQYMS